MSYAHISCIVRNIMINRLINKQSLVLNMAALLVIFLSAYPALGAVKSTYLYTLSNFTGAIPYYWARLIVDNPRKEVYVLYQNLIRVFNDNGMEVYEFGDDVGMGHVVDATVNKQGDMLLLAYENPESYAIIKCNYRGQPTGETVRFKGLPAEFAGFKPTRFVNRDGKIYLASLGQNQIVITDGAGNFIKGYNVNILLKDEGDEKNLTDKLMVGFNVDRNGNILFTIPVLFKVYIISPEGKLDSFGKPGGAPGRFGVIAGVTVDSRGNYIVADKTKCVIDIFDKDYNFLGDFGYRGGGPSNLIAPDEVVIDDKDRLYITQGRAKGVSVFQLNYE